MILSLYKYANNIIIAGKNRSLISLPPVLEEVNLSIHIPTRAEPFEIVKECIECIVPQLKSNDEIIIIDNNHEVYEDYKQLQEYCYVNNIRFQHHDYLEGYKAGALNQSLQITSSHITHILVIDCDYNLQANALEYIRENAKMHEGYGFIQFPQAYRDTTKEDVENELNKYFDYNLFINQCVALGTGTLCCIKKSTLLSIGGWPTKSITEDALFGLKIQENGLTGLFIPKVVGKGLLPHSIKDYYNQRKRWIYGNAEVLIEMLKNHRKNNLKPYNFSQLSTWLHFSGLTIAIHILTLIAELFYSNAHLVLYFVYGHYIIILLFKIYEFSKTSLSYWERIRSLSINWLFLWTSSFHWLPAIFNKSKSFVRTPKLNIEKIGLPKLPFNLIIIHLITAALNLDNPTLYILAIFFVLLDLYGIKILLKNYK